MMAGTRPAFTAASNPSTPYGSMPKSPKKTLSTLLDHYDTGTFFDEMFTGKDGEVRPHYRAIAERFRRMTLDEFTAKEETASLSFLKQGPNTWFAEVQTPSSVMLFTLCATHA